MSTPTATPRRVRKRILIPALLLALLVGFFAWLAVRAAWADTAERNPRTVAEGPVTQLYRTPQDDVQVRCAILIDAPPDKVWEVIRDYPNQPRFLPYVSAMAAQPEEGDRVLLTGTTHSRLWGDWPFAVHVDHKKLSDTEYVASWDEPTDTMTTNRGAWRLTGTGPGQTLAVFALQVDAADYPNLFVRNVLLDRLHKVLGGLRDEVHRRQAAP